MIHFLTGGKWGYPLRRFFEAAAGAFPLMLLLFLPIFFGLRNLYPWMNPTAVAASEVLQHKRAYLNAPGFHHSHGGLSCALELDRALAPKMVAATGHDARSHADDKIAPAQRPGARALPDHRNVRLRRLDHVARSRLVFDHVPDPDLHRANAERARFHDHAAGLACAAHAAGPNHEPGKFSSSGESAARVYHDVDLHGVRTISHHLVGRFAA